MSEFRTAIVWLVLSIAGIYVSAAIAITPAITTGWAHPLALGLTGVGLVVIFTVFAGITLRDARDEWQRAKR